MSSRLLSAVLAVVVCAAFGVAGCGQQNNDSAKKFKGDDQQVAKVIESLESAAVKGRKPDGKKICTELITDALAKTIASQDTKHNCDGRIKKSLEDREAAGGVATLEVLSVKVDGNKAVASVKAKTGDDKQTSDYTLERDNKNVWRISSF